MSAYPFVKFDLLPKLEVGHLSSDLLLVSEVREGVEVEGQVINGEVVLPGIILKRARQETCHKRTPHILLHILS